MTASTFVVVYWTLPVAALQPETGVSAQWDAARTEETE